MTLQGQSKAYWAGTYAPAEELNPIARIFLEYDPVLFIAFAVAWATCFTYIIRHWRSRWTLAMAFTLTFCHALGAASWLPRHGWIGWIAAGLVLVGAERLWTAATTREPSMRNTIYSIWGVRRQGRRLP